MRQLGDSLPEPLGPVTACVLEYFSCPTVRKDGDYKRFLQGKGCWREEPVKIELSGPFSETPLDVSEAGRRLFDEFLHQIVADERKDCERIQGLHMGYMVCPHLPIMQMILRT